MVVASEFVRMTGKNRKVSQLAGKRAFRRSAPTHVFGPDPEKYGGREGTRTPDFLVANEEKSKLRCGVSIT